MQAIHWPQLLAQSAVKFTKFWLKTHLNFPQFSAHYVRRHIERPETEAGELREFRGVAGWGRAVCLLMVLSSCSFVCCVLVAPIVQMLELNYKEPARNLQPTGSGRLLHTFNCLLTDCPAKLKEEEDNNQTGSLAHKLLLELPLFSLCHPKLAYYHEITQLYGPPSFLLVATLSIPVLLGGLVLPALLATFKSSCWLLMFLVAPTVTRRVVHDRALELYDQLKMSCVNFERNSRLNALSREKLACAKLARRKYGSCATQANEEINMKFANEFVRIDEEVSERATIDYEEQRRRYEFAHDCLPLVRTQWWHSKMSQAYLFLIIISLVNLYLLLFSFYFILGRIFHQANQLKVTALSHLVHQNNCTIWKEVYDEGGVVHGVLNELAAYEELNLVNYVIPTHPLGCLLYVFQLTWPFIGADLFLLTYLLIAAELFAWLHEIKLKLRLVNEYLRQNEFNQESCCFRTLVQASYDSQECSFMENFSQLFEALTSLLVFAWVRHRKFARRLGPSKWLTTDSQLEFTVAIEAHVTQSLERHSLSALALIELLEKLQVSLRLFVEQVRLYGPIMSVFLALMNIYIYTYAITMIVYIRRIDSHNPTSLTLMITCWFVINWLLWFISSFHAKARQLQPLIWSLLAMLSRSDSLRNLRFRHAQSLWLKQVVALDRDGGLALKAFNLSITYIRSIQLFIGSATLMTLALR